MSVFEYKGISLVMCRWIVRKECTRPVTSANTLMLQPAANTMAIIRLREETWMIIREARIKRRCHFETPRNRRSQKSLKVIYREQSTKSPNHNAGITKDIKDWLVSTENLDSSFMF